MEVVQDENSYSIVRFQAGEEVIAKLQEWCAEQGIQSGWVSALGAASAVTLSFYDLAVHSYQDREVVEDVEIVSLVGNIARASGIPVIHLHGSFGTKNYQTLSGHVKRVVVSATCEMLVQQLTGAMERQHDDATGLHLLSAR